MLGLIVWCLIFIFIAACITPWWFIPAVVVITVIAHLAGSLTKK